MRLWKDGLALVRLEYFVSLPDEYSIVAPCAGSYMYTKTCDSPYINRCEYTARLRHKGAPLVVARDNKEA